VSVAAGAANWTGRAAHRSLRSVQKVVRWRKALGISPFPFVEIPKRKRHCLRFHRIAARIKIEEQILRSHLEKVTRDLERRIRVFRQFRRAESNA
jgi:hypothetical protein